MLAINILMVSSLRSVTLINEISLGQVGFAIIGAYTQATLMMKGGLSFWPSLILSALISAFVALLLAYPFLKVRGIYFSILTLLTAETFRLIAYYWTSLTGGSLGLTGVPGPGKQSVPFVGVVDFNKPGNYYYIAIGVVLIALLILYYVERAYINFQWRAIKDDNTLAGAVGINVIGYKMVNFVIAAFMAGLSGALFASYQHNLSPDTTSRFGVTMSIYLLVYMVVGGKDYFIGPLVGTFVLTLLAENTRSMQQYQPMITGAIAILVMIFMPMGLVGLPAQIRDWRRGRRLRTASATRGPDQAAAELAPMKPAPRLATSRGNGDGDGATARSHRSVSRHFGGLAAVNKVDLMVEEGEILGLIGPNGAGKSTLLNLIDGTLKVSGGTITFRGRNITRYPPHRRAHLGIARVFQKNALFKSMTVLENVIAGSYLQTKHGPFGVIGRSYRAREETAGSGRALSWSSWVS